MCFDTPAMHQNAPYFAALSSDWLKGPGHPADGFRKHCTLLRSDDLHDTPANSTAALTTIMTIPVYFLSQRRSIAGRVACILRASCLLTDLIGNKFWLVQEARRRKGCSAASKLPHETR